MEKKAEKIRMESRRIRKKKPAKGLLYAAVILCGLLIGMFLTIYVYANYVLIDVIHIPMDFKISDKVGFNAGTDALHFGKTLPGGASMRKIDLTNNADFDVNIRIRNTGNFSNWIEMSKKKLQLKSGERVTVYYNVAVPEQAPLGTYNGTSTIIITRKLI